MSDSVMSLEEKYWELLARFLRMKLPMRNGLRQFLTGLKVSSLQ